MFCYQKNFFNPTLPVDEAQFYALVRATKWAETIDAFRQTGEARLKRGLPAFIFQATFDETTSKKGRTGRWRKQAATRLTGLVVMDVDHVEQPRELFDSWQSLDFATLGILLVYVTPSGHGLKIVFKARTEWGNLIDNQHQMACRLGVVVDESCKDASRMSFICKEEDILFINKEMFTYENKEFSSRYDNQYRDGRSAETIKTTQAELGEKTTQAELREKTTQTTQTTEEEKSCTSCSSCLQETETKLSSKETENKWLGYDIQTIIDRRYAQKMPCAADSNRHKESLKLAYDLLVMLDGDRRRVLQLLQAQPWVQEIIAERDENVGQTVDSAADLLARREKSYAAPMPSKAMQDAVMAATGQSWKAIAQGSPEAQTAVAEEHMEQWLERWGG